MSLEIIIANDSYTKQISGNMRLVQSLDGDELQYNTLDVTLDLGDLYWSGYQYGDVVEVLHDGSRIGKFYLSSMVRVSQSKYQFICMSGIGLLANSQHYGGIYSGTSMAAVLDDVVGGIVPYTLADGFRAMPVYGWLPVATRRENLHQVLFAMGASVLEDENGDIYIAPLSDENRKQIPDGRIYLGGDIKYPEVATSVAVSEHAFVANAADESIILHEGAVPGSKITTPGGQIVDGGLILFEQPMHDLIIEGGTLLESGVNFAVISPTAYCLLRGQKYNHTIRQVTRPEASLTRITQSDNKITVSDATLVSIANSENVADRLMAYYSSAKEASLDIVMDGEAAGDAVTFREPFGELAEGIIQSMDVTLSRTLKAKTKIIKDYVPESPGNFYSNVEIVTNDWGWTAPAGITKIRVVLIGGGAGGSSGSPGKSGTDASYNAGHHGDGGAGGAKGAGGQGGNILIFTMDLPDNGDTYFTTIGQGGAGGVCTAAGPSAGSPGTATTFAGYSSADGAPSVTGFAELFGGVTYGLPGAIGVSDGGAGNGASTQTPDVLTIDGVTYSPGARGATEDYELSDGTEITGYGGYGGGAAYGANGNKGQDGEARNNSGNGFATGGDGGTGATPLPGLNGVAYGSGGQGGSGGGGGGGGGAADHPRSNYRWDGDGGAGGLGSNGGNGAPGCIIIYY